MSKIAIIRIRGGIGVPKTVRDTMDMLQLKKKNNCVVRVATPTLKGMVQKVKDYIAYGEIDEETFKLLETKKESENFYRLQNPLGGFERKGIKLDFNAGGVVGYRGIKINELIKKMVQNGSKKKN
ncbi:MAG: uL30 family ribosomal protein [Nanoarchaeota archaeon]|nr:uL30 family ribosomal protein [Nanoarchaeota archaeon]